ncbi:hypothetical protein EIK77_003725 [Talaromyces pinophilus]|nr:hypothetical protein EIK77_003725 [Talaromyces pinophilus]
MFVTFFDTCMVALAAMFVWRISPFIVFLPWLTIACLDGTYLSSSLTKVPVGAWFTITLAAILASLLLLWRFGKEQQWNAEAQDRFPTSHFIKHNEDGQLRLMDRYGGTLISTTRGLGIFFDKAGETTPIVFSQFVLKLTAIPEVSIFFHLRPMEIPSVSYKDRYSVSRLAIPNCYRLVVRYGYNDVIITPDLASVIVDQVRRYLADDPESLQEVKDYSASASNDERGNIQTEQPETNATEAESHDDDARLRGRRELEKLQNAHEHKVLYIIGKEQMTIRSGTNILRKVLLHTFLWIRENTRNKMANLRVPADRVIEVGFLKEI